MAHDIEGDRISPPEAPPPRPWTVIVTEQDGTRRPTRHDAEHAARAAAESHAAMWPSDMVEVVPPDARPVGHPRTWTIRPETDSLCRPLEPGEELTVRNESGERAGLVAVGAKGRLTTAGALLDVAQEADKLKSERDAARAERDSAISYLGVASRANGRLESLLDTLADRLDYLENLWGAEAVTRRAIQQIREARAEMKAAGLDDTPGPAGEEPDA